jgi:hypothetical protein
LNGIGRTGSLALAAALMATAVAQAHIRINPAESTAGARETYRMRVPNEKQVDAVRIEGEFPAGLSVYAFEPKPGFKVQMKKDAQGAIVGATWTGALHPYEFLEFGMLAINPREGSELVWKFVQYYADGTKEEFTGPMGSRLPSPVVKLTPAPAPAPAPAPGPAAPATPSPATPATPHDATRH